MSDNTKENEVCQRDKFEKNKYFYGKLMTVSDFETEQSYFDEKRHLINRMLHGSGLICGFENITVDKSDGNLKISFIDGGVALDCCGREIVVPPNAEEKIVDSNGNSVPDLPETSYLYLKYKACYGGYVGSASNPSSCAEKCCPGRIVEGFEVVASDVAPKSKELECRPKPEGEESQVESWLKYLEKNHRARPSCADKEWVFLATVVKDKNGKYSVNYEDTAKHRIFFTQKELYQLFKCHILDTNNPHQVTAIQTGALVSIDGVKGNDKGNVDLEPENSIVIKSTGPKDRITIGENHSLKKDNPHQVTAAQAGALVSIDGVSNPGGNVDLIAGPNVTITPNTSTHTIEIASTGGGGVINPGTQVQSVGTSINAGTLDGYARENHVHNLGEKVVDVGNLSEKLQEQLKWLSMYVREKSLISTVSNFKAVAILYGDNELAVRAASNIVNETKGAVRARIYEKETDFILFMNMFSTMMKTFAGYIEDSSTPESYKNFRKAANDLIKFLQEGYDVWIITKQQEEVCFYISELELLRE